MTRSDNRLWFLTGHWMFWFVVALYIWGNTHLEARDGIIELKKRRLIDGSPNLLKEDQKPEEFRDHVRSRMLFGAVVFFIGLAGLGKEAYNRRVYFHQNPDP